MKPSLIYTVNLCQVLAGEDVVAADDGAGGAGAHAGRSVRLEFTLISSSIIEKVNDYVINRIFISNTHSVNKKLPNMSLKCSALIVMLHFIIIRRNIGREVSYSLSLCEFS